MSVNNTEKHNFTRDPKTGQNRLAKGNTIAKKRRNRTQTDKLLLALKNAGEKRGKKFWEVVADKAFIDKEIMKTVVNKLVPNISELTGAGGEPFNFNFIIERYEDERNQNKTDPQTE